MSFNPTAGSMSGASDVALSSPQNLDVLTYQTSTGKWSNGVVPSAPDATTLLKGKIQLAGDLGGTSAAPTVPGLATKANLASPTFTGTVSGITASMVGLANVNNTSDANKPVSTATQTALNLKSNLASPTFTGTVTVPTPTNNTDAATKAYVDTTASAGTPDATTLVKGKVQLAGDLGGTSALPTVPGLATKAPIASPTFTGTVSGVTASMVGLANVNNTSDANKPVSTATQTALNLKADLTATVQMTGNQTVAGIKTFSSSPIVPTPTTGTQATNKTYVDSVISTGSVPVARSTTYTAANNDFVICDATAAGFTVTLPTATAGAKVRVLKLDASANGVLVMGNGNATLAGSVSFVVNQRWASQDFAADGTNWYCV